MSNAANNTINSVRELVNVIASVPTSDGAGVKLRRSLGSQRGLYLDPFLMLDEFGTDNPGDYIAGFPAHPHRGFETVTYMLDGRMRHRDHLGNVGDLGPGSVQWMSAGRGVIHSEMPLQERGRMRGFQLWINLPAAEKMNAAAYRDIPAQAIPSAPLVNGGQIKVIAGCADTGNITLQGPINSPDQALSTDPIYFDIQLAAHTVFEHHIKDDYNAFVYCYEGEVHVGKNETSKRVAKQSAGILSSKGNVRIKAGVQGACFILLAAKPIQEPIVQYGPFVMNTRQEIEQAILDYQTGVLV
jgi:redox-sensitive bicupin YhaK (pirin superfamily)